MRNNLNQQLLVDEQDDELEQNVIDGKITSKQLEDYRHYRRKNSPKKLTKKQQEQLDNFWRNKLQTELRWIRNQDIRSYMVFHKQNEIKKIYREHRFYNQSRFLKNKETTESQLQTIVDEVNRLRWKPVGRSDFRRIEPELLLIDDSFLIPEKSVFDETTYETYENVEPLVDHWNCLRVFISSSRHDGVVGRALKYLVRDKVTKTYLGIICIGSTMRDLTYRNWYLFGRRTLAKLIAKVVDRNTTLFKVKPKISDDEILSDINEILSTPISFVEIYQELKKPVNQRKPTLTVSSQFHPHQYQFSTNKISEKELEALALEIRTLHKKCFLDEINRKNSRQNFMANGQTLMGVQPFARSFNGGKLLALLSISDKVQSDWEKRNGQKLVFVETTSLYGDKSNTQYDGLRPFWNECGMTSGEKELLYTDDTYERVQEEWLQHRFHFDYWRYKKSKNENSQQTVREKKQQIIKFVNTKLNVKESGYKLLEKDVFNQTTVEPYSLSTLTGHPRGVFICPLYENTDEFLQGKITEKELIKSFPTDIETLTELWKYGYEGDYKKSDSGEPITISQSQNIRFLFKKFAHYEETRTETGERLIEKKYPKRKPLEKYLSAKSRINTLVKGNESREPETLIPVVSDWYEELKDLTLKQALHKYRNFVGS
jgi:hypothetical protein